MSIVLPYVCSAFDGVEESQVEVCLYSRDSNIASEVCRYSTMASAGNVSLVSRQDTVAESMDTFSGHWIRNYCTAIDKWTRVSTDKNDGTTRALSTWNTDLTRQNTTGVACITCTCITRLPPRLEHCELEAVDGNLTFLQRAALWGWRKRRKWHFTWNDTDLTALYIHVADVF